MEKSVPRVLKGLGILVVFFLFLTSSIKVEAASERVSRISGERRFETAVSISNSGWSQANTVMITDSHNFADALAGVPLAHQLDAPILLARGNQLEPVVRAEIGRLKASRVIILGGRSAVSEEIERELTAMGLVTERLEGETRFDTAQVIARELVALTNSTEAAIVNGYDFADAMSVASFAAMQGMPVYLSRGNELPAGVSFNSYQRTYIIGGEEAITNNVVSQLNNPTRLAGLTRYETNQSVIDYFNINSDHIYVATGRQFPDSLTGSVLAAKEGSPIVLTNQNEPTRIRSYISVSPWSRFTLFGGEAVVNRETYDVMLDQAVVSEMEDHIFMRTNELRRTNSLSSLEQQPLLRKGARIRSRELIEQFSHTRPDGRSFGTIFEDINYSTNGAGENIAYIGVPSINLENQSLEYAQNIYDLWRESLGHYENMIRPSYNFLGVGLYIDRNRVNGTQLLSN